MSETTEQAACWDCRGNTGQNDLPCSLCKGTGKITVTVIPRNR